MSKKLISILAPCYNEEGNVVELCHRVKAVMAQESEYDYEHIFIDNASTDRTLELLEGLALADQRVKVIVNSRNFGHIRSPYHALMCARGHCVVLMASDLQEPPELISSFLRHWEKDHLVIAAIKTQSLENGAMYRLRSTYYAILRKLANVELLAHFTGFGLYDRKVVEILRSFGEPYPYFRGLISEIGYPVITVPYTQPIRKHGKTSNNLFTLFDIALLGLTNHSKVPLRLATITGLCCAVLSLLIGIFYLASKLLFWNLFAAGISPAVIGILFLGSIQLFFLGIVGEYIGAIFTYSQKRPLVVELRRINF